MTNIIKHLDEILETFGTNGRATGIAQPGRIILEKSETGKFTIFGDDYMLYAHVYMDNGKVAVDQYLQDIFSIKDMDKVSWIYTDGLFDESPTGRLLHEGLRLLRSGMSPVELEATEAIEDVILLAYPEHEWLFKRRSPGHDFFLHRVYDDLKPAPPPADGVCALKPSLPCDGENRT